ncbi:hypothetical protein H9Q08_12770 [Chryseobacterium sp. PS-8]|uniref:Uncharacterized protein n=1 Tax=Chryseobacterium indicum TaxID=2766954 RepID=A0ABS9C875_9FLAO|nr:hypothetical protein [Chryseobacterium sp. PS-8]MCF2220175.1 hypothetical protein [Chryseobacterium sp. PS-8]
MKSNSEKYFEKLSSRILMFIDLYKEEVIKKILNSHRFIKEDEKYFYTIILKTIDSLNGANIFIRNFDNVRSFQVPLFIIIRAILNDIIISEYIIVNSSNDEEQIKLINSINFEHIKYIKSSIKIESKIRKWSEQEKQEKILEIIRANPKYYEKNGNEKFKKIITNVGSLVDSVLENSINDKPYQLIGVAYILYNTFSKLEHFGELSFDLVHKPYKDNKQSSQINHLFSSIQVIIAALNNYCRAWKNLEIDFDKLKSLEIEILKMTPDFTKP